MQRRRRSTTRTQRTPRTHVQHPPLVGGEGASKVPPPRLPATQGRHRLPARRPLTRIVERDFPEQGRQVRAADTLRRWLAAYAAATSTTASYNTLLRAATPGETQQPAKTTTIAYRDILNQLWLLDPVPAWSPGTALLARLGQSPKLHLADPALAATLLGSDAPSLLAGDAPRGYQGVLVGALFASLVTLSLRVHAQAAEATVSHLRDRNGSHEIDLVVAGRDHRLVALEVKPGGVVTTSDVKHLTWLREGLGDAVATSP